ncbi:sensor histidine kinase [Caryophanon latum]|uniref:histidine kinase n=1 Tax=Caryophanon latum TaxID=33977 RepID=A0A1C0YFN7_9BACL|nr:sensor histidine kinase [Caryophanon latum]OCS85977.1 histidine kinase [Caryophanon latum]
MNVQLFLREHMMYIILQIMIACFMLTIYWLEGFRDLSTAFYALGMSLLLMTSFLATRYVLRLRYYTKMTTPPTKMEDALHKSARTPESQQVEQYVQQLYRIYQFEVQALYANKDRHDQFMNQWVHQMKTPISVIELLLQEEEVDRQSMREEVERLKNGLEMVLMNARLEKFEEDLQVEMVDLKSIVSAVVNEHKRLFITKRIFPQVDIEESLIVTTDSKWLKFIVGQFITNAVKYTFEPQKKVYIFAVEHESGIDLIVRDEGIGIPKSDLSRVTKAFFTGENGRKTGESTGMGLYLAHEVALKLGHELIIESEVNVGTSVTLRFQT